MIRSPLRFYCAKVELIDQFGRLCQTVPAIASLCAETCPDCDGPLWHCRTIKPPYLEADVCGSTVDLGTRVTVGDAMALHVGTC